MKKLTLVTEPEKISLNNSRTVELSRLVKIKQIKLRKEFQELFPVNKVTLEKITSRMKEEGYDNSQPVHLWDCGTEYVLIDGHHRRLAAIAAGFTDIPGFFHSFDTVDDAVEYAMSLQTERRNLNDGELLAALAVLDSLKARGKGSKGEKGKSAERTAKALGTSTTKVEKARAISCHGSPEIKEAVGKGKMSLNQAYEKVKDSRNGAKKNPVAFGKKPQYLPFLEKAAAILDEDRDSIRKLAFGFMDKDAAERFLASIHDQSDEAAPVEILAGGV